MKTGIPADVLRQLGVERMLRAEENSVVCQSAHKARRAWRTTLDGERLGPSRRKHTPLGPHRVGTSSARPRPSPAALFSAKPGSGIGWPAPPGILGSAFLHGNQAEQ